MASAADLVAQFIATELPLYDVLVPYIEMILAEDPIGGVAIAIQVLTAIAEAKEENYYDNIIESLGLSGGPAVNPLAGNVATGSRTAHTGATVRVDGPGGFLWKPVSESTGKLVVLTEGSSEAKIYRAVEDSNNPGEYTKGDFIEKGNFASIANGGRHHYRFSKPGSGYGPEPVFFDNVLIKDPSARND